MSETSRITAPERRKSIFVGRLPRRVRGRAAPAPEVEPDTQEWSLASDSVSREPGRLPASHQPDSDMLQADALDRLARLRRLLPLLAEELAGVRREAARLRVENRRLLDRLGELESPPSGGESAERRERRSRAGAAW